MTTVALPVAAYQLTKSPIVVSLVAASGTIPYVIFGLFAGALADRADRRRIMITTDLISALCMFSITVASTFGVLSAAQIVAVALISSSSTLFFEASAYGLVPAIVGKQKIASANSALYGSSTVVRITGTAAAGVLIAVIKPGGTIAIDAASFIASAYFIRIVAYRPEARPAGKRPGYRESIREGGQFLWGHRTLRTMTVVGTLQSISGGAIIGQLVVFAGLVLGIRGGDPRIGLLYTAWSVGGIGGSVLLPILLRKLSPFQVLLFALPAGSLLGALVISTSNWLIAIAAIAAWGSVYLVVLVNTMNYCQQVTPDHLQSRVNTTRRVISSGLGVPLGALASSTLTTFFNITVGMAVAVVSVAVAAIIVWLTYARNPELRQNPA